MAFALNTSTSRAPATSSARGIAGVRVWLWALAALVFCMVVVGGATRMTGSGLSITEWRPVMGAIPPLDAADWAAEFAKYRESPQYQIQNSGMTLGEFKAIYWWEWSHRQLGRLVGLAFGVGFLVFAATGALRGRLMARVLLLGTLGGLQGAIGWIMVASGLKPGMTAVEPVKLMLHLTTASVIFAGLVAVATGLGRAAREPDAAPEGARSAFWLMALVLAQIALGALVAGSHAGLVYNTWPLIDGAFVPPLSGLMFGTPWYENFVDNHLTVQFQHRMVAYAVLAVALWQAWSLRASAPGTSAARRATALAGLVAAQAAIGIWTLLAQAPLALGLLHQAFAMVVLGMAAAHWRLRAAGH
ncbi:COX15/CtaA family protein [Alsobacter sp. SYSU M60028]|uniref:Heme A synthase n=1 Tax=Alsobacter ponti TaxID=2962936 RepID=A0ABT1LEF8_9HYPH|nr:COX15/CtaA family protein [Alsobacter ponti]MCP8939125.1 COX15/CtaA family protein [Alsobacter ponti]